MLFLVFHAILRHISIYRHCFHLFAFGKLHAPALSWTHCKLSHPHTPPLFQPSRTFHTSLDIQPHFSHNFHPLSCKKSSFLLHTPFSSVFYMHDRTWVRRKRGLTSLAFRNIVCPKPIKYDSFFRETRCKAEKGHKVHYKLRIVSCTTAVLHLSCTTLQNVHFFLVTYENLRILNFTLN